MRGSRPAMPRNADSRHMVLRRSASRSRLAFMNGERVHLITGPHEDLREHINILEYTEEEKRQLREPDDGCLRASSGFCGTSCSTSSGATRRRTCSRGSRAGCGASMASPTPPRFRRAAGARAEG